MHAFINVVTQRTEQKRLAKADAPLQRRLAAWLSANHRAGLSANQRAGNAYWFETIGGYMHVYLCTYICIYMLYIYIYNIYIHIKDASLVKKKVI